MKLNITQKYNKEFTEDTENLSTSMLSSMATHLFIASNFWDEVNVELNDDVEPDTIRYLASVTGDINVKLHRQFTKNDLDCLCMLYPDKAGLLRYNYMSGGNVQKVVNNIEFVD